MAIYAFLADISAPEDRSFRFGMLFLSGMLAGPISPIAGAKLLSTGIIHKPRGHIFGISDPPYPFVETFTK